MIRALSAIGLVCVLAISAGAHAEDLRGTVMDVTGAAIEGATVFVHADAAGGITSSIPDRTLLTNRFGKFDVELAPGFYDVCTLSSAFTPRCQKVKVVRGKGAAVERRLKVDPTISKEIGDTFF